MKFTITAGIEVRYKCTNTPFPTKVYEVYLMNDSEELIGELSINSWEGNSFRFFKDTVFSKYLEKFLIENATALGEIK